MAIAIHPYTEDRIPAVKAFNRRLAEGGVGAEFHFPESNVPHWLPKLDGSVIFARLVLATNGLTWFEQTGFMLQEF